MRFFAWPFFRLTHLTFRPQKRDKQVARIGHSLKAFQLTSLQLRDSQTVLETLLMVWSGVLRSWPQPPPPPPHISPLHQPPPNLSIPTLHIVQTVRAPRSQKPPLPPWAPTPISPTPGPLAAAHFTPLQLS